MFHEIHENSPTLLNGTIAGSLVTAIGSLWANFSPDQVMPWVTMISGVVWVATNLGIMIYKRVSAAIRDDQREWREYDASLEKYHAHGRSNADPGYLKTPDPDLQKDRKGPG